jgi:hypothetical protein
MACYCCREDGGECARVGVTSSRTANSKESSRPAPRRLTDSWPSSRGSPGRPHNLTLATASRTPHIAGKTVSPWTQLSLSTTGLVHIVTRCVLTFPQAALTSKCIPSSASHTILHIAMYWCSLVCAHKKNVDILYTSLCTSCTLRKQRPSSCH